MESIIRQRAGYSGGRYESGITLLLSILVLLSLTFMGMGLLYLVQTGSEVSSNIAVQTAALEASDYGLHAANQDLQSLAAFPEASAMTGVPWWYPTPIIAPATVAMPVDPAKVPNTPGFWTTCATSSPPLCGSVSPPGQFAGRTFIVEFVVEPTGLPAQIANGYTNMPFRLYEAFVNVQFMPNNSPNAAQLSINVESTLRKVGS